MGDSEKEAERVRKDEKGELRQREKEESRS